MSPTEDKKYEPDKVLAAFYEMLRLLVDLNDEQRQRVILTVAVFHGVIK